MWTRGEGWPRGAWAPAPTWAPLGSGARGILTALSQDKAATLLGVIARLICHVDAENVVGHEVEHVHVARVFCVRGIVRGPAEAAGGDLVHEFSV